MNVSLNIKIESLETASSGPVVGDISLSIGNIYFPCENWNDFVLVILGWWVNAILRISTKISDREIVDFMDGPYSVEVTRISNDVLSFSALDDSAGERELVEGEENINVFAGQIVILGKSILDLCRRNDCWSNDADNLRSSLISLEKELFGAARH